MLRATTHLPQSLFQLALVLGCLASFWKCEPVPYQECLTNHDCNTGLLCQQGSCQIPTEPTKQKPDGSPEITPTEQNTTEQNQHNESTSPDITPENGKREPCQPAGPLHVIPHFDSIHSILLLHSRQQMILGTDNGSLLQWDWKNKKVILRYQTSHTRRITHIVLAPNGTQFLTSSNDKTIKLWTIGKRNAEKSLTAHNALVHQLAFRPDGKAFASSSSDGSIQIWAWPALTHQPIAGHKFGTTSICFSKDGKTLYSGGGDKIIQTWNVATKQPISILHTATERIESLFLTDDEQWLVYATTKAVFRFHLATKQHQQLSQQGNAQVTQIAYQAKGNIVAIGTTQGSVSLYQIASGNHIHTFDNGRGYILDVQYAKDNTALYAVDSTGMILKWDLKNNVLLEQFKGFVEPVKQVLYHHSSNKLLTLSDDSLTMWDPQTWTPTPIYIGTTTQPVKEVVLSPDGSKIAWIQDLDSTRVYDLDNRKLQTINTAYKTIQESILFKDDNTLINIGIIGRIRVWNITTKQEIQKYSANGHDLKRVAISPNKEVLAVGASGGQIILFDLTNHTLIHTLEGHTSSITALGFSTNKTLFSASKDGSLKEWDVQKGIVKHTYLGHTNGINALAIHPTAPFIATASQDNTIKLWDTTKRTLVQTIKAHSADVNDVSFDSKGQFLASGANDATVRIWKCQITQ